MTTPLKLAALTAQALPQPGSATWRRDMEAAIVRGHTAGWIAGTQKRLGVRGERLLNPRNLSRAERAELRQIVDAQLKYLADFDPTGMSDAAIAARSEMYARSVGHTYQSTRWGDWDIPQELMPGQQQCLANCRCAIAIRDNGDGTGVLTRTMHGERHCPPCEALAGDHSVERRGYAR